MRVLESDVKIIEIDGVGTLRTRLDLTRDSRPASLGRFGPKGRFTIRPKIYRDTHGLTLLGWHLHDDEEGKIGSYDLPGDAYDAACDFLLLHTECSYEELTATRLGKLAP